MKKYIEVSAPVYKINNIPASQAGEWPGIKSNKFEKTKKIIRAVESGIFFTKIEPKKRTMHRSLSAISSPEYVFKPGVKRIKQVDNRTLHQLGEGIFPTPPEVSCFIPKVYEFQKIEKYHLKKMEEHNKLLNENLIMNKTQISNDIKSSNKTGFTKEFFENVSNNKLLGVHLNKDLYYKFKNNNQHKKNINEFINNSRKARKLMEVKKEYNLKIKQENFNKDVEYVKSL